jgi:hypothetical protein
MTSTNLTNNHSVDKAEQAMPYFSVVEEITMVNSASFLPLKDNFDATSIDFSTAPDRENSHTSHQTKHYTQTASSLPGRNGRAM